MFFILTKHPSYSFSCITPCICVFCRNEENDTKSKQFGQEMRRLCLEELMVSTTVVWLQPQLKTKMKVVQQSLFVVETTDHYGAARSSDHNNPLQQLRRPMFDVVATTAKSVATKILHFLCGHDHGREHNLSSSK